MTASVTGIIADIILFFIIAGNAVLGYRRGLTRVIFSLCSTIIAIILVFILYRPITNYIINNTSAESKLETILQDKLLDLFESENIETAEEAQESENGMFAILKVFIGDEAGDFIEDTTESIIEYASVQVARKIISVVVFFALFAIVRIILYILRNYIELVANLPIIRVINGSGGMIYGVIRGFLIIYAVFAVLSLILPVIGSNFIITAIENAPIGSKMFYNNIILNLIFKFL